MSDIILSIKERNQNMKLHGKKTFSENSYCPKAMHVLYDKITNKNPLFPFVSFSSLVLFV